MSMQDDSRFDWSSIFRSTAVVVGGAALVGFAAPPLATLALQLYNTKFVADSQIFRIAYWVVAWGLMVVQGTWMLKNVGDRIIDDMLVIAIISALVLTILLFIIGVIYEATTLFSAIDAGGALLLVVVALVAARTNRF